jgi:alpha-L-arabinofuranosidase
MLQWVEALGAEGIMGLWAGYALGGETVSAANLQPYIVSALNQASLVPGLLFFRLRYQG